MKLNLDSLFYEDYYHASWSLAQGGIRRITWSTVDDRIRLPNVNYANVTASLDSHISIIRKAFDIWDKAIDDIRFVKINTGNSADITVAATNLSSSGYWSYLWDSDKKIKEATIQFNDTRLEANHLLTTAMHEIGNILGLGDLHESGEYKSVQEDPFPEYFYGDQLWEFDEQMINTIYPNKLPKNNELAITDRGTSKGDFMFGGPGNDELIGLAMQDYLVGHDGNDTLRAGSGRDTIIGGNGDDYLGGGKNGDELFGGNGNDILQGGNGRDSLSGGLGADDMYGGFGHNTFGDERDGSFDWLFIKSDQFVENWLYGRAGMNPSGQKVDIIKGLDQMDRLFIEGVNTSDLTFSQVDNFAAPTGNFSGIGIYANGFLEGLYTGGDLTSIQLQSMTTGVDI